MATIIDAFTSDPVRLRERRFFLGMAAGIALIVLVAFGGYIVAGISSFNAPWWVHLHALLYTGWIALYLNQNWLIVRGASARHAQMGRMMAVWMVAMVIVGIAILFASVSAHRSPPPVFSAGMLFVMDGLHVLGFVGLVCAGLALRAHSDWHKRMMLSATIVIIAPAFGRLTVLTIGFSWLTIVLCQLAMIAAGSVFDRLTYRRVHPAYIWGAAVIVGIGVLTPWLAEQPAVIGFAKSVAAGG